MENGSLVEHFMGSLPLKKAMLNPSILHSLTGSRRRAYNVASLLAWALMVQQCLGKKSGVQARPKKNAPHTIFIYCHCQLAIVQSANSAQGIKQVYTTLTTSRKFFYGSLKRCESLKDVQKVIDITELKIATFQH